MGGLSPGEVRIEMKTKLVTFMLLGLVGNNLCSAQFCEIRAALKHHFRIDNIRVFYDVEGANAVDLTDANTNGIPDVAEDVAMQTLCARHILVSGLGFQDPLESERYGEAEFVDINILSKQAIKLNGIAYDGLQRFDRSIDPKGTQSLCFDVSTGVQPTKNHTPTHEYFHLVQNGYTYFKTRWYTEGMARWAEHAVSKDGLGRIEYKGKFPHSIDEQKSLFRMAYDSEFYLWNPLAKLADIGGRMNDKMIPREAIQLRYVNGDVVVQDLKLNGADLIRDVLVRLGEVDDSADDELAYNGWTEANQKSEKNSPYIYKAILDVARERGLKKIGQYEVPN